MQTSSYGGGLNRPRVGPLTVAVAACLVAGCQTMTLKLPALKNPILMGKRLHVGDTPLFETSTTGEHYEGVHKHDLTVASSQYSTSTSNEWERNAQANAQWAFQGTLRRAVRDTTVVASVWVANFFVVLRGHEDIALRGDVVTVDPPVDDFATFSEETQVAPPADAPKPAGARGGES